MAKPKPLPPIKTPAKTIKSFGELSKPAPKPAKKVPNGKAR